MARRRNKKRQEDTIVDVVEAKDHAQSFLEKNQSSILGALALAILLIGGLFAYRTLIKTPKEMEAAEQMRQAQIQFERDSFALALTNPGAGFKGFLDIAKDYSGTKAGNTANYYAGISYLNIGEFEAAISYLNDFNPPNEILAIMKNGALADAYAELKQMDKAAKYYKKAVRAGNNEALNAYYLKKLALFSEKQGNTADAKKYFQEIKDKYPNTDQGAEVDKYISRLSATE